MPVDLTAGIVRILKPDGTTSGTGFILTDDGLIATCAHVITNAGAEPGKTIRLSFHHTGKEVAATVDSNGWRDPWAEDIAILRLDGPLPEGVRPLPLGRTQNCNGHSFVSFGFPEIGSQDEAHIRGTIYGLLKNGRVLQVSSGQVAPGVSGAPVLDTNVQLVVGIISEFPIWTDRYGRKIAGDSYGRHTETNYAIPTEVLLEVWPPLKDYLQTVSPRLAHHPLRANFFRLEPLPPNYVPRLELLAEIKQKLLSGSGVLALHGMGGIGKSVLARALCDDPDIRATFADGILWAELGQNISETELKARLSDWIRALGGIVSQMAPTLNELKNTLAELLNERACLLIVDNVWKRTDAETFRVVGPACRLLLTTRDAEVARELGADVYTLPGMTQAEAVQLLEEWAGGQLAATDTAIKIKVVERLGCLPLAIKLAGSQLRCQELEPWLAGFNAQKLKSQRPKTVYDNLYDALALSLDVLDKETQYLYTTLAIFKGAEAVPTAPIDHLWSVLGNLTPEEVNERLHGLADQALLQLDLSAQATKTVSLHDLLRDFITDELGTDGQLQAHQAMLAAYGQTQTGEGWPTAPDDGYLYDHLAYHLHSAGQDEELHVLFENDAWLKARFQQCGYTYDGFLTDLEMAWTAAQALEETDCAAGRPMTTLVRQVRYGLLSSSIVSLSGNVPPQLLARAVEVEYWSAARGLALAAQMREAAQRAKAYIALLKTGRLDKKQHSEAQERGIEAALAIRYESSLAEVLGDLAPHLEGEQLSQMFKAALEIQNINKLSTVLKTLSIHLKSEYLYDEVFELALIIQDAKTLLAVFEVLAPYLNKEQLSRAKKQLSQKVIQNVEPEYHEAAQRWALNQLEHAIKQPRVTTSVSAIGNKANIESRASQKTLPETEVEKKLSEALAITDDRDSSYLFYQLFLLSEISSQLRGKSVDKVLDLILAQTYFSDEALAVIKDLTPRMNRQQLVHILKRVLSIESIEALEVIAPHLDQRLLATALEASVETADRNDRMKQSNLKQVLIALAPYLHNGVLDQALQVALTLPTYRIFGSNSRWEVLAALSPNMNITQVKIALQSTLVIPDQADQVTSLATLIIVLEGKEREIIPKHALNLVMTSLEYDDDWLFSLVKLFPLLNQERAEQVMDKVLAVMEGGWWLRTILSMADVKLDYVYWERVLEVYLTNTNYSRIDREGILAVLAPHLNQSQLQRVLAAILEMEDKRNKVEELAMLIPWLNDAQLPQVRQVVLEIQDEPGRVVVLAALAQRLQDESLAMAVVEIILQAVEQHRQVEQAQGEQFPEIWVAETAINFQHLHSMNLPYDWLFVEALIMVAPLLQGEQLRQAMKAAEALYAAQDSLREMIIVFIGAVMGKMALIIKGPWRKEIMLGVVKEIITSCTSWPPEDILSKLASRLNYEEAKQILGVISAIESQFDRAEALRAIAPYLKEELLEQALAIALALSEKYNAFFNPRAEALAKLAPYLEDELQAQTLKAALSLEFYGSRAMVLNALADGHPDWVQAEANILRPAILQILRRHAKVERSLFLYRLAELQPVWLPLAPAHAAWDIAQTIIEICDEWEWQ